MINPLKPTKFDMQIDNLIKKNSELALLTMIGLLALSLYLGFNWQDSKEITASLQSEATTLREENAQFKNALNTVNNNIDPAERAFTGAIARALLILDAYEQDGPAKAGEVYDDAIEQDEIARKHLETIFSALVEVGIRERAIDQPTESQ
jgi:hypothetical protein